MPENLDALFGPSIPAQRTPGRSLAVDDWERGNKPVSFSTLGDESAAPLKRFMSDVSAGWRVGRTLCFDVLIIWAVDESGEIVFAVEETIEAGAPTGRAKHQRAEATQRLDKLGHPALVGGGNARIAGEIRLQEAADGRIYWEINNRSGRYGLEKSRKIEHLSNVKDQFAKFDLTLEPDFVAPRDQSI